MLRHLLRDGARFDRSQADPIVALRNTIGITAPLAVGALAGNPGLGLASTIGALQTGFADRPGPYRLRLARMFAVAVAAGVTSALAVAASQHEVLSILLLAVLAFGAGLLLSAGPSATQFGIAATGSALVLGHIPQPASNAVHVGLLVVAGGVLQTVLAIAGWPLRRHRPERLALATVYRDLATAARASHDPAAGPPAAEALTAARATLFGLGHDHGSSVEAYRVLLDEAERIRRELLAASAFAERLDEHRLPILAGLVRGALASVGGVLDEVAAALTAGRPIEPGVTDRARASIDHAVDRLEHDAVGHPAELSRRGAAARLRALAGQLRAVVETAATGASEGRVDAPAQRFATRLLHHPLAIVRANLEPGSAVVWHAVRLAVLVAGSDALARALGLDRGYWVALTLLVVLRPDFGATLQRASFRTVGTIVGLLLATVLVHYVPGGDWWEVALVAAFAFAMRLSGPANVAPTAVALSGLVVLLLQIQGIAARTTLLDRGVATVVGGVLAVLALLLLPSWERQYVPGRLAALLHAYRDFLLAVVEPTTTPSQLDAARSASRLSRTNAQASVDRAAAEPVPSGGQIELGRTVLANTHRFVHAVIGLDALRDDIAAAGGLVELHDFSQAAAATLDAVADAITNHTPPRRVPSLRERQRDLVERVTSVPAVTALVGGAAVASGISDATDRIANSLDTLVAEVRRQLTPPRSPAPAAVSTATSAAASQNAAAASPRPAAPA